MAEATANPAGAGLADHAPDADNYLKHGKGVLSWLFTLDHKRIGVMYLVAILGSFFLGGVFALVIGLIGCLEGMQVQGTAQSVGERTTSSVVQTISLVIVIDAFAALWFMEMGW